MNRKALTSWSSKPGSNVLESHPAPCWKGHAAKHHNNNNNNGDNCLRPTTTTLLRNSKTYTKKRKLNVRSSSPQVWLRQQKNEEHTLKRRIWWSSNVSSRTSSAPERPYIMLIFASFAQLYFHFHSDHLQDSIQIYLCSTMKKKNVLKNKDEASQGLASLGDQTYSLPEKNPSSPAEACKIFFWKLETKKGKGICAAHSIASGGKEYPLRVVKHEAEVMIDLNMQRLQGIGREGFPRQRTQTDLMPTP